MREEENWISSTGKEKSERGGGKKKEGVRERFKGKKGEILIV